MLYKFQLNLVLHATLREFTDFLSFTVEVFGVGVMKVKCIVNEGKQAYSAWSKPNLVEQW
jgi:hypothetical protein